MGEINYWVYVVRSADGDPLYVGMTGSVTARLKAHRSQAPWWAIDNRIELILAADRASASDLERSTIEALRPAHNIDWNVTPLRAHRGQGEWVERVLHVIANADGPIKSAEVRKATGYRSAAAVCHRLHRAGVIKAVAWKRQGCRTGWVASWVLASSPLAAIPMPEKAVA